MTSADRKDRTRSVEPESAAPGADSDPAVSSKPSAADPLIPIMAELVLRRAFGQGETSDADLAAMVEQLNLGVPTEELVLRIREMEEEATREVMNVKDLGLTSLEQDVLTNPTIMAEIAAHQANPGEVIEEEPREDDASEDEQIASTVQMRTAAGPATPLADLAEKLGLDPDDYR